MIPLISYPFVIVLVIIVLALVIVWLTAPASPGAVGPELPDRDVSPYASTDDLTDPKLVPVVVALFVDERDARVPEKAFWRALDHKAAPFRMEIHAHQGEGGATTTLHQGGKLVGVTARIRDEHNRTLLLRIDLREPVPHLTPAEVADHLLDCAKRRRDEPASCDGSRWARLEAAGAYDNAARFVRQELVDIDEL